MAARVGRISATAGCRCAIIESVTGVSNGLVMGSHFLLRNLLVAHLSDDSLRAHLGVAGLSAPGIASRVGSNFSRLVQCRADSIDRAGWGCRSLYRAAYVGLSGVGTLHDHGPNLERARLFPSIPSRVDSICPLGWCLCG